MYLHIEKNKSNYLLEFVMWIIIAMFIFLSDDYFSKDYNFVILTFIIMNMILALCKKEVINTLPVYIIRLSGVIRFLVIPYMMRSEAVSYPRENIYNMMVIEIVSSYLAIIVFSVLYNKKRQENKLSLKENNSDKIKVGVSVLAVSAVSILYIMLHRKIFVAQFIHHSSNSRNISGFISICISAFLLLIYIFLIEFIHKMKLSFWIKLALILMLSIILIGVSAISERNVSRWSMLIMSYIVYQFLKFMFPKHKKMLMLLILMAVLFTLIIGTVMKVNTNGSYTGYGMQQTLSNQLNFKTLNAYFSGPKNVNVALDLREKIELMNMSKLKILVSDIFANFPYLNKYLSNQNYQSNLLFNFELYQSDIAYDQILPLAGQLYIIFGNLYCLVIFALIFLAMKVYFSMSVNENKLMLYCKIYIVFSLALINCINLTIMLQNIWIHVLPIWLIYIFNIRLLTVKKIKLRNINRGIANS